jgi:hypothetical protein
MLNGKFHLQFLISFFLFILISKTYAIVTIKADNPNFHYTGRIDFTVAEQPTFYWPGTYVKAKFEGPIVFISLNDQTGQTYYNVFIDEDFDNPHIIDCSAGSKNYLVSATLKDTVHSILIFRRTEASTGPTKFLGIQLNDGKNLVESEQPQKHKIIFYGNSITCGMGNEAPDNGSDDKMAEENNFLAYGAVASRLLNADYICIAKSGIGIIVSWFDLVMPDYYYRLNPDDSLSYWDFSEYIPDVVVVNLFQNDSWLIGNLKPVPDSSQIVQAYYDFIQKIRQHHSTAYLICSLGSMDATRSGSPWPGYIEEAVRKMQIENADSKITTFFFPFDPSWTKHPRVRHHLKMGQNLVDFINQKLNWDSTETSIQKAMPVLKSQNDFFLFQNYPNPFNPTTNISFQFYKPTKASLDIFDLNGNLVRSLFHNNQMNGSTSINWDGKDTLGYNVASGIYFYSLKTESGSLTRKMMVLK